MRDSSKARDASRREALKKMVQGAGALTAFPILGQMAVTPALARAAHLHLGGTASSAPDPEWKPLFFDDHQNQTVITLTELIIPATRTPGAKAALVNRFIDLTLNEETGQRKKSFVEGLAWLDRRSATLYGKLFAELAPPEQTTLLTPLADPDNARAEDQAGVQFFQDIKDLTIYGYYTSKIGMEQELEYGGDDYHAEFPGACNHPEHQT